MFFRSHLSPPDVLAVLETSGLLAVSEFRVFELAHVNWYGVAADEQTIERHFFPYMFREEVPHYVRAFTRKILGLERAGRLDPQTFGIEPDRRTVRGMFPTTQPTSLAAQLASPGSAPRRCCAWST